MALDLISLGLGLIDKIIPDPQAKQAAQLELLKLQQSGDLAQLNADTSLAQGQLDVDKTEAASSSFFVSGGRPAIIWVCAISLACYYIPYALVSTVIWAMQCIEHHALLARPDMGLTDLLGLTAPLLGLSTMRSVEKIKGVAK